MSTNLQTVDRDMIIIEQNRLYEHKSIRFRSTTYDARRMEETAKPSSHADIMVLAHEDDSSEAAPAFPYWHAWIVGIYHVMVRQRIPGGTTLTDVQRMDVLLVRWFGLDSFGGWRAQWMHSVGFLPDTDILGPAFGFLDPDGSHMDGTFDTRLPVRSHTGSIEWAICGHSNPSRRWRVQAVLCRNVSVKHVLVPLLTTP